MIESKRVLAVIMGGGRGTRLFPLTQERCKPAVPLAGKYRLVDIPISNCINSGYNRIFLLTQFLTASLHRHIQKSFQFDPFGAGFVDILSAEQTDKSSAWYEGTADAVRRNLVHFDSHEHELVLILSGDQLYRMDFRKIIAQHLATNADVTIAATPVPVSRVEGLGLMRVADDLAITEFVEKPKDLEIINGLAMSPALEQKLETPSVEKRCLASMGIYVFSGEVLRRSLANSMKDFGKEVIPGLLGKKKLFAHIFEGYWEDIGTVRAFFDANLALAQPLPPFNFFEPNAPMLALVERLHGRWPLYLLSNTSDIHRDYVFRRYPVFARFTAGTYSYAARASKPGAEIFHRAIRAHGLEPARTFFIDDLLPNIETARALGFRAHHYHHDRHAALEMELAALGV